MWKIVAAFGIIAVLCVAVFFTMRQQPTHLPLSVLQSTTPSVEPTATLLPPASGTVPSGNAASWTPVPANPTADAIRTAMNARRTEAGVAVLRPQAALGSVAQRHAADMATRGFFSHTDPDGVTFQQRVLAVGYAGTAVAENIGLTSSAATEVIAGWMDSNAHRTNMLNGTYGYVGIGTATGMWQGVSVTFVVAIFGDTES